MKYQYIFVLLLSSIVNVASGQISISPNVREFTSDGGGGYVIISGTGTWTATSSETWISIQPRTNDTADKPCIYVVSKNSGHENRDGNIYINDLNHKVVQYGEPDRSKNNPPVIAARSPETAISNQGERPPRINQDQNRRSTEYDSEMPNNNSGRNEYLVDRTLGIIVPFKINDDNQSVPLSFSNDYHGDSELPSQYVDYLKSKNVFKDVIIVNDGQQADYYLSGYVKKVHLGNRFLRFYSWTSMFGGGRSYIELSFTVLSPDKNPISTHYIVQKARRSGSLFRPATWSHKANLQTAIEATKDDVFNYTLIGVIKDDPSIIDDIFSYDHPTHIRDVSKMVYFGTLTPSKTLSNSYSKYISEYLRQPSADEYVVDAVAWVCMAIGKAQMNENISDLKMLIDADINSKIANKALTAYNELK